MPLRKRRVTRGSRKQNLLQRFDNSEQSRDYDKPGSILRFKGLIIPDHFHTHLEYTFGAYTLQNAASSGTLLIAGNSAYDPDKTGTGSQPVGFDQFSAFYLRYRVRASSVFMTLCNTTGPIRYTATPTTDLTYPTTVDLAIQAPYTTTAVISSSIFQHHMSSSMSTGKIWGTNSIIDDNYTSDVGGDPVRIWYWRLRSASWDGSTVYTATVQISIVYEIEFYDRVQLAQS